MKAQIIVNRHIVNKNKKNGEDKPCISIKTYKGVEYVKEVILHKDWTLKQDFENPPCSGATIWLEGKYENLTPVELTTEV